MDRVHALLTAYRAKHPTPRKKSSNHLPVGTQVLFIDAAIAATNAELRSTIRWTTMPEPRPGMPIALSPRITYIVELLRKSLSARGIPAHYIWVREHPEGDTEHWHFGLHLPTEQRQPFTSYLQGLTGEPKAMPLFVHDRTEGEIARGVSGSWHFVQDTRTDRHGYYIAAYLGKGEASQIKFRGKLRDNSKRPVRGTHYGGDQPIAKYDSPQGALEGSATR